MSLAKAGPRTTASTQIETLTRTGIGLVVRTAYQSFQGTFLSWVLPYHRQLQPKSDNHTRICPGKAFLNTATSRFFFFFHFSQSLYPSYLIRYLSIEIQFLSLIDERRFHAWIRDSLHPEVGNNTKKDLDPPFRYSTKKWSGSHRSRSFFGRFILQLS